MTGVQWLLLAVLVIILLYYFYPSMFSGVTGSSFTPISAPVLSKSRMNMPMMRKR